MKNYHDPEVEIILLPENDIIVTSLCPNELPGDCLQYEENG